MCLKISRDRSLSCARLTCDEPIGMSCDAKVETSHCHDLAMKSGGWRPRWQELRDSLWILASGASRGERNPETTFLSRETWMQQAIGNGLCGWRALSRCS